MVQGGFIRKMPSEAETRDELKNQADVCDSLPSQGNLQCKGPGADSAKNFVGGARRPAFRVAM